MTVDQIISSCIKKDEKGQKAFFDAYSQKVMSVCRRYASCTDEAKELFQECFIQLLQSIGNYKSSKGELEAWIYKVCYYTIINQKKNKIQFFELNGNHLNAYDEEKPDFPITTEELISEIQNLPEGYRIILNLFVFDGLSHDEIAECLGITASTSRSQLTRARATLKKRILNLKKPRYASGSI